MQETRVIQQNLEDPASQPRPQQSSPISKDPPSQKNRKVKDRPAFGLFESLDTFAALAEEEGGVLDLEAAAAVPDTELRRYLEQSLIDPKLIPTLRKVQPATLMAKHQKI